MGRCGLSGFSSVRCPGLTNASRFRVVRRARVVYFRRLGRLGCPVRAVPPLPSAAALARIRDRLPPLLNRRLQAARLPRDRASVP